MCLEVLCYKTGPSHAARAAPLFFVFLFVDFIEITENNLLICIICIRVALIIITLLLLLPQQSTSMYYQT